MSDAGFFQTLMARLRGELPTDQPRRSKLDEINDRITDEFYEMAELANSYCQRADTAEAILRDMLDPYVGIDDVNQPCYIDERGYCQTHSWMADERACPVKRAKELLGDE